MTSVDRKWNFLRNAESAEKHRKLTAACRSKKSHLMRVCAAAFVLFAATVVSGFCQQQTINFRQLAGPSEFSGIEPPLQVDGVTISGGQILTNATNLPVNAGTVYGTASFCSGCLPAITLDFTVPVSKFSIYVMNGNIVTVTYTVADNQGGSQTISLVANFLEGAGTVTLPDSNITQVNISAGAAAEGGVAWDFLIDYISFTPAGAVLVDPIPNTSCGGSCLLSGSGVTSDPDLLATLGTVVQGVASDGVTQLVVRIPAAAGQQATFTLTPTTSNTALGELADPVLGSSYGSDSLTVTAVSTVSGPMVFAAYKAPLDFSQGGSDDTASQRIVSLQIQIGGGPATTIPITILRPPVVLVHGLWDDSSTWSNFTPILTARKQNFFVETANYSSPLTGIVATSPTAGAVPPATYTDDQLAMAKASALGFAYNAPTVLSEINQAITDFKIANNAAAVQADIVAHSMGGDITRFVRYVGGFASSINFGSGSIHKLITIGTPHLGSPLATQLLEANNACVAGLLAGSGSISFRTVTLAAPQGTVSGGVADLVGNGKGGGLSSALEQLQSSFVIPIPTAVVAGVMSDTNLNGVGCFFGKYGICAAQYIRKHCGGKNPGDPLAQNLTVAGWPTVLGGASDAVVPVTSELNNTSPTSPAMEVSGVIHSRGMESLDFMGPVELDSASGIAAQVIVLLNEFLTGDDYHAF
jgi:pimeloyl-ACP methyl ester carboxylesterase